MKGIDRINGGKLFSMLETHSTRGHGFRVSGERYNTDIRGRFFTQRVVGVWNALPSKVVEASTLELFKINLDRHMRGLEMGGDRRLF